MATMLDVVRTALRRTSKALDDAELKPLIEAAKLDLNLGSKYKNSERKRIPGHNPSQNEHLGGSEFRKEN